MNDHDNQPSHLNKQKSIKWKSAIQTLPCVASSQTYGDIALDGCSSLQSRCISSQRMVRRRTWSLSHKCALRRCRTTCPLNWRSRVQTGARLRTATLRQMQNDIVRSLLECGISNPRDNVFETNNCCLETLAISYMYLTLTFRRYSIVVACSFICSAYVSKLPDIIKRKTFVLTIMTRVEVFTVI